MHVKLNVLSETLYPDFPDSFWDNLWENIGSHGYDYPGDGGYSRLISTDTLFYCCPAELKEKEKDFIYPFTILLSECEHSEFGEILP